VGCIAVATIVLPVCITTAGGVETQSFAIAHLFSAALLFEALPARRPAADVEI
jgi:acid phosphatase family membrane protein YuiD